VTQGGAVRGLIATATLVGLLGTFSCSLVLDFDRVQCSRDADCAELGDDFKHGQCTESGLCIRGPECINDEECSVREGCFEEACVDRWACLDDEVAFARSRVSFEIEVKSIFDQPLPDTPVKLCSVEDMECAAPLQELVTDENARLKFELSPGARAYLDAKVPSYFPQLSFLPEVLTEPMLMPSLTLSPIEFIEGVVVDVNGAVQPGRGHLLVEIASCLGGAPGLVIASGQTEAGFYLDGGPSTELKATGKEGTGGFVNIPPGKSGVQVSLEGGEQLFTADYFIRAETISVVQFRPPGGTPQLANGDKE
jgi:hypothetical protein